MTTEPMLYSELLNALHAAREPGAVTKAPPGQAPGLGSGARIAAPYKPSGARTPGLPPMAGGHGDDVLFSFPPVPQPLPVAR